MSKVFLDYGHGGSDPGAIGNGVREKDLTLQIGKKVARLLRNSKQTVVESRTTDRYLSLAQRTRLANNSKADLFVSIHINSFTRATAHGVETFSHTGSKNGAKLAKAIQDELVKTGLFRSNRGVKTANFYVIRNTTMPAALTELGFISNKEDVKIMTTKQDELAKAIADGILKYLGKGASKPTTPSKPKPSKPAKKSNATIAKEVMAGKWGNNPKRKNDLIKAGYDYAAIQAEVNKLAGGTPKPSKPKKTIAQMAQEVRAGKHGTGHANRRKSLGISQSEYNKVRAEVNRLEGVSSTPKPSFNANAIARQIKKGIDNKGRRIPNGHANRQKHFGLTNAQYQQVRSIVNRIM